jgi:small subunit ribosomal protein S20
VGVGFSVAGKVFQNAVVAESRSKRDVANTKSAIKAHKQSQKRVMRNRIYRSGARTAVKRARVAIATDVETAPESVVAAIQALDRAASKGVIHKNNAARRKSRLMQALNQAAATA